MPKPINLNDPAREAAGKLAQAFKTDDGEQITEAFVAMQQAIAESVRQEYEDALKANDQTILIQRGFRVLTNEETEYYQAIIEAMASRNPKQAFATIAEGDNNVPGKMMPETIINDVFKNLTERHGLLGLVNATNTGYITTWLRNKHTRQLAKWGEVEGDITQEIKSAFEIGQVTQGKLSCYMVIHRDMLELGPVWMDAYVRTVLLEAMACGLEFGIVAGKGVGGEPIGLDRDIREGVTYSTTDGFPRKQAIAITSFTPEDYAPVVSLLAKDERGHIKESISSLTLVCNLLDYLTKVMPATTVLNTQGTYVNDLFPVPTRVVTSEAINPGEAILCLPDEYDLLIGGTRGIEYSDEYRFLEDQRCGKVVTYAFGKAYDNTSSILLDISGLEPGYVNVAVKNTVATTAASAIDDATLAAATKESYWGHNVADLQENVSVVGGKVFGTLKKVTTGQLVTDWGEGYFIALKWTCDSDATSLKVGLVPSEGSGLVECVDDADRDGVIKVTDPARQKLVIITSNCNTSKTQTYDLSNLVLAEE